LPARKIKRQLHHQSLRFFNGRKECVAHECLLVALP
jgi:hypothetical protein